MTRARKTMVIAAMDTPMTDDGNQINPDHIPTLMQFLRSHGIEGVFIAGSTGLGPLLREDEWRLLVQTALESARSEPLQVLVNVTAPSTHDTLRRVDFANEEGARHLVVATPTTYRYEKRAVLQYFSRVFKRALPSKVYLYRRNNDGWGEQEAIELRRTHENFIGIKDSATDMASHLNLLTIPGLDVYQGYEALIAASVIAGGAGPVSGLATALPRPVVEMTMAAVSYKLAVEQSIAQQTSTRSLPTRVWDMQHRLTTVRHLVCGTNPYAAFKALLNWQGIAVGIPREPFIPLSEKEINHMTCELERLDIKLDHPTPSQR